MNNTDFLDKTISLKEATAFADALDDVDGYDKVNVIGALSFTLSTSGLARHVREGAYNRLDAFRQFLVRKVLEANNLDEGLSDIQDCIERMQRTVGKLCPCLE